MENRESRKNSEESREVRSESGESEVFSLEELQSAIEDRKLELEMISAEDVGTKDALEQRQTKLGELADATEQYTEEKGKEPGLEQASEFADILDDKGPEIGALKLERMAAIKMQTEKEGGAEMPIQVSPEIMRTVQAKIDAGGTYEDIISGVAESVDRMKKDVENQLQENPELQALVGRHQEVAELRQEAQDLDAGIAEEKRRIREEQQRKDGAAISEVQRQLQESDEQREEVPIHDVSAWLSLQKEAEAQKEEKAKPTVKKKKPWYRLRGRK